MQGTSCSLASRSPSSFACTVVLNTVSESLWARFVAASVHTTPMLLVLLQLLAVQAEVATVRHDLEQLSNLKKATDADFTRISAELASVSGECCST